MKCHVTRNDIRRNYDKIYQCGYANLANLLTYDSAKYYNSGVYGWNFDVYEIYGIALVTGYRNCIGKKIDYEICKKYESKAKRILEKHNGYENTRNALQSLKAEFVKEVTGGALW